MEDNYEKSGFQGSSSGGAKQMYLHYHEFSYLKDALESNGLKILHVDRKEYPDNENRDLVIIAKK